MQKAKTISISKFFNLQPVTVVENKNESKFAAYVRSKFEIAAKTFDRGEKVHVVADTKKQRNHMLSNRHKISITRHMTFRDSYTPVINLNDEVLSRISYRAFVETHVIIDKNSKPKARPSLVTVRGEKVNFKNRCADLLTKLIRRNHARTGVAACTCEYCGLQAKYVYFVRSIFNATIGNPNFIVRIIGINKSGEEQEFNVDHIVAQASSGQNSLDNMQITCARCNRIKSALPHEVFERDAEVIRRILRETN